MGNLNLNEISGTERVFIDFPSDKGINSEELITQLMPFIDSVVNDFRMECISIIDLDSKSKRLVLCGIEATRKISEEDLDVLLNDFRSKVVAEFNGYIPFGDDLDELREVQVKRPDSSG